METGSTAFWRQGKKILHVWLLSGKVECANTRELSYQNLQRVCQTVPFLAVRKLNQIALCLIFA